ncbi:MAG: hypothetical protein Q9162_000072 [Coniocarpon cinnabarinum]
MSVLAAQARPALQAMQHPHDFRLNSAHFHEHGQGSRKRTTFRQHVQNARNLHTISQTVALPLDSSCSTGSTFNAGPPNDSTARPEDLLRRKTPGGILSGAYDGSFATSKEARGHASKHVLVSRPRPPPRDACDYRTIPVPGAQTHVPFNTTGTGLSPWIEDQVQVDSMVGLSPEPYCVMDWQYTNPNGPRVMQPPYQTILGPTASNEHSPHGPYWPNGDFAPYRPAAFADSTQQPNLPGWQPTIAFANLHVSTPPKIQSPGTSQNEFAAPQRASGGFHFNKTNLHSPRKSREAHLPEIQNAKLSFSARTRLLAQESRDATPTISPTPSAWSQTKGSFAGTIPDTAPPYAPSLKPSPTSNEILSWSYGIYNDLVGVLRDREFHNRGHSLPNDAGRTPQLRHKNSPFLGSSPYHQSPSNNLNTANTSALDANPWSSPCAWSHPRDLKREAYAAVNALNSLCSQGNREWIDGMLLNGCLSQVLGEHQNAARWCCRILQLDPNHAEAASNLAASYMALNRRAEAEECWRLAINIKPTYFEAIEHLVGLLCYEKRHKEAIQIIDHVQAMLRSKAAFEPEHQFFQASLGYPRYAIPVRDNGRMMGLIHSKGNLMYNMQDQIGAAKAFEEVVLIAVGYPSNGIEFLIKHVLTALANYNQPKGLVAHKHESMLLLPEKAVQTAALCFPNHGSLPGLDYLQLPAAKRAAISVTSNSLLSLAKIFQDGMNPHSVSGFKSSFGIQEILALYYLSLSLQPSPSTANNVGILLASIPSPGGPKPLKANEYYMFPGVAPDSGVALALQYYRYGLKLDHKHAHLYTNLGSLLKDIGQLPMAIQMYERAVTCDGNFDIALANLANAVKDQGRVGDAIGFYRRAVQVNPKFAEAVCGLANALNSICEWPGRGGMMLKNGKFDRFHVGETGELRDALNEALAADRPLVGWINRVVDIVENQLLEGQEWGRGVLCDDYVDDLADKLGALEVRRSRLYVKRRGLDAIAIRRLVESWRGKEWEGALIVWLIERAIRMIGWQWYHDKYTTGCEQPDTAYHRPRLPDSLSTLSAPTVLPFHTFTLPLSAKQVRQISQRNGLRVSCSTLRTSWLPQSVYPPPAPPAPTLKIGYVSSDFNNHPLAHLMQSVFGMHDRSSFTAYCYATSASDNSVHRQQIERESPHFIDASAWPVERLVAQIVRDGIHILINLNGYTRGARNEIFAARPAPVQMSFMGYAGSLGAEWCDYLLADETAVPSSALRPHRNNVDLNDLTISNNIGGSADWVYPENVVYTRHAFFCCDHAQSATQDPMAERNLSWSDELTRRWQMRQELFPDLPADTIILANFNQLYKIDPTTFRTWLRILSRVRKAVLWLLRFPADGASNLQQTARIWAGDEVASRICFTDVAPKGQHIARACVADLFLDTGECNAHTTAADCLWSGTPLLTLPRYEWKMCSRMAAGIVAGALNLDSAEGRRARNDLIAEDEDDYERKAIALAEGVKHVDGKPGDIPRTQGRLVELRRTLWKGRWTSKLFDTQRWVRDLELAYKEVWRKWVEGEGGDVWIKDLVKS